MFSRFAHRALLLTLAVGLSLTHWAAVSAQEEVDLEKLVQVGSPIAIESGVLGKEVNLLEGQEITLKLNQPIERVFGFHTGLIRVRALRPDILRIEGRNGGQTTLSIKDEEDTLTELTVTVKSEVSSRLRDVLKELYPNAKLQLYKLNDSLLIRGTVATTRDLQQVTDIADEFYPNVLNYLSVEAVASQTESVQIPEGMRVVQVGITNSQDTFEKLTPEDHVDVVVTYSTGGKADMVTKTDTLLEDVELYATSTESGYRRASLLVTQDESGWIKYAERRGDISLVPRTSEPRSRIDKNVAAALRARSPVEQETPAEAGRDSDLRSDIRALHADVKRLIELLEQRQSSTKTDPRHAPESRPSSPAPKKVKPANAARPADAGITLPPDLPQGRYGLFFYSDWATESQESRRLVETVARQELVKVYDLDVGREMHQKIARQLRVAVVPTMVLVGDRKEVGRTVDFATDDDVREFIRRLQSPHYETVWNTLGLRLRPQSPADGQDARRDMNREGMLITEVREEHSQVAQSGLREGDVLVGLGISKSTSIEEVYSALVEDSRTDSGKSWIHFHADRDGEALQGELQIDESLGPIDNAEVGTVLLFFQADWCRPCQQMVPLIRQIDEEGIVRVRTVDVDKERALAEKYGVTSLPTMVLLRDGEEAHRWTGTATAEQVLEFVQGAVKSAVKFHVGFTR